MSTPIAARVLPVKVLILAAAALAAGCASQRSITTEVTLDGPIGGECMMAALDSEPGVSDLVRTGEDAVAFRLSLPDVEAKHWPPYALVEEPDESGVPVLTLSTRYEKSLFGPDENTRIQRAGFVITHVTESCTGNSPTLGAPEPCGKGETRDLCVRGR